MIDIPLDKVLEKLKEAGLSEEDIENKIKQKMDQLSGLISREGAAHIIANEMKIKLVDKASGRLKVKDILPGMRNIEFVGKVTNVFNINEFQRQDGTPGKVGSFIAGDETGTIRITCWGTQADNVSNIKQNDIIKVAYTYAKDNRGRKELHLNDSSKLTINPQGEEIGDISPESREYDQKKISELSENSSNVEILGTVVSTDALRFFEVCPDCGKRARLRREDYVCETHGDVKPDYSYVMNITIDDGTGNIRVVFFREMVEKLLGVDKQQLLTIKETPDIENLKNKPLGNIVKIKGRVKKNQMFDRLEFACQDIDVNPDPYEEMENLDSQIEAKKNTNQEVASIDEI